MPVRFAPACLTVLVLLGGCAGTPDDGLLGSSAVVASEPRRDEPVIEVARFSGKSAGAALPEHWQPWIVLPSKPRTEYRLVESEIGVVLEAQAASSASGLMRVLRVDPRTHRALGWHWLVPKLVPGADPRSAPREDAPARLIVSFHGDPQKLDFFERTQLRLARALSGRALPYATLMYVWSEHLPVGSVIPNPHTDRIRMIVVESGTRRLGRWVRVERDLLADYRRAFGEEPWDVVAIGLMTDTDNTGTEAKTWYGDIVLRAVAPGGESAALSATP